MARTPWAVMDGASRVLDAEEARVAVGGLWTPGTTAVTARQGLRPGPGTPGKVKQTGTPGINVLVDAFQLLLTASRGSGPYIETEPAQLTVAVLDVPADPSNQRNDLILFRQTDTYYSDVSSVQGVIRVQGTPSGTPADPSVAAYPDHGLLARVRVPAGATAITDAMIDDLRPPWVVALGGILPVANATDRATLTGYDSFAIYRLDRDWVEIHDGTAWRVQGIAVCSSTADRDSAITSPYNGLLATTTDSGTVWLRHSGAWVATSLGALAVSVSDTQEADGTTTSGVYTATLTGTGGCSLTFVAPVSGKVQITNNANCKNSGASPSLCSIQVRAGAVIGSGTVVLGVSNPNAVFSGTEINAGRSKMLHGLTPFATYNAQQLFATVGGTATFGAKHLSVTPVL